MIRRAGPVIAAALVLASCTGSGDPAPTSSTRPPPTSSAPARPTAVPAVVEPLDLRPHRRRSCALLSGTQLTELSFPPRDFEGAAPDSGRCEWRRSGPAGRNLYSLTIHVSGDPLGGAYRAAANRLADGTYRWALFEERTVRGLPAVVRAHLNRTRYCDVVVGTGGGQGISVGGSIGTDDPELCDRLVAAAELVVDAARRRPVIQSALI